MNGETARFLAKKGEASMAGTSQSIAELEKVTGK